MNLGLQGYFRIEAVKPDGSRRILADWQPNLITNGGLDMPGTKTVFAMLQYCRLGTGSTAPAFTDVNLASQVASVITTTGDTFTGVQVGTAPYYKYWQTTYHFAPGVATGNISEIGIAPLATGQLFSRALIKDAAGTPLTITVLADEQLDVIYQFRIYQVVTDYVGTITVNGIVYTFTMRASEIDSSLGVESAVWVAGEIFQNHSNATTLGAITSGYSPRSGTYFSTSSFADLVYTNGTYYRQSTVTLGLTVFNVAGGLRIFELVSGVVDWQASISPPFPKDATKVATLTFRLHWARFTIP